MRFVATQTWPLFWKAPIATSGATFSTSTSGKIIEASFPPSSRVTRLSVLEQDSMTFLPVGIEPVKEILSILGWAVIKAKLLCVPLAQFTLTICQFVQ